MRFKTVPEPPADLAGGDGDDGDDPIERARRAIPLVPASEDECCARLIGRLSLPARDAAREWLTFCRALGLVAESESGFHRSREDASREAIAHAFRERVYGVREVLSVLDDAGEPLAAEAVTEEFAEHVPQWERFRYPDSEEVWDERVRRIVGWAAYFGFAERADEGYSLADDPPV